MKKLFLCFIHIPKCGGMTFDEILKRNLGNQYLRVPHGLYEGPIPRFNLKLYIEESNTRLAIGGHRICLDLPFDELKSVDLKAICFVREPLARLRSEFFYIKQLPGNVGQNKLIRQLEYPQYLEYLLQNPTACKKISHYQIQHLFGKLPIDFDLLTDLIDSHQLLLFPLEQFSQACLYLEKALPNHFINASYVKRNINQKITDNKYQDLETKLRSQLIPDNRLYTLAEHQFKTLIDQTFSPSELKQAQSNFARGCQLHKYFYEPAQRLTYKLYRLASSC